MAMWSVKREFADPWLAFVPAISRGIDLGSLLMPSCHWFVISSPHFKLTVWLRLSVDP